MTIDEIARNDRERWPELVSRRRDHHAMFDQTVLPHVFRGEPVIEIAKPLGSNYHIQGGKMLYEIKPRGFSKATAIQAFMKESPFRGRRAVFIGDDLTDQDGFAMVESQGGLSVGGSFQPDNTTDIAAKDITP